MSEGRRAGSASVRRRFGTGRGPLLTSSPPIFTLRGRLQNRSAWPRVSYSQAPGDPKLSAPQVGRAGLVWPVGVPRRKGLIRSPLRVKSAAAPLGLEAPGRPRLSSKRGAGSCELCRARAAPATWIERALLGEAAFPPFRGPSQPCLDLASQASRPLPRPGQPYLSPRGAPALACRAPSVSPGPSPCDRAPSCPHPPTSGSQLSWLGLGKKRCHWEFSILNI